MRLPQVHQFLVAGVLFACCAAPARSELRVAAASVDLGVIRGGQKLTHRFELVNRGGESIEILDLKHGCGCLAPRLDQRVIPPGGKATLVMELRTLGQADGPHTWELQVHYRAGADAKTLRLSLRGTVQSEITVQPAILGLHVSTTVQQEVTLTDARAAPLRVVDAEVRAAGVRVTKIERAGKTTKIVVAADGAKLPPGRHEGFLTITTDDADYGQLQVPIVVTKAAALTAVRCVPERVELRLAPGTTTASALVRLRSTNDRAIRVAKIEASDSALVCTWAAGPGNDATVRIQALAARLTGAVQTQITVHLATPADDAMTIPVMIRIGD